MPANGRRGQPQGQCHRKQTARARPIRASNLVPRARAKRCGKSAPRPWQQGRQGKPHREQDRIGAAAMCGILVPPHRKDFPSCRPGWSREARRKARPRRMVVPPRTGADRTRLTDCLVFFLSSFLHILTVALQCSASCPQSCPQERNANILVIQNCLGMNRSILGKCLRKRAICPGRPTVKR
jgi:hypothetical protein